jgi:hypothetical protein
MGDHLLVDDEAWEVQEPSEYEFEPDDCSDVEPDVEPDQAVAPGSVEEGEAQEDAASVAEEEEAADEGSEREALDEGDESSSGPEADDDAAAEDEFETSWAYEPGSAPPEPVGPIGGYSSVEEGEGAPPVEWLLEGLPSPVKEEGPPPAQQEEEAEPLEEADAHFEYSEGEEEEAAAPPQSREELAAKQEQEEEARLRDAEEAAERERRAAADAEAAAAAAEAAAAEAAAAEDDEDVVSEASFHLVSPASFQREAPTRGKVTRVPVPPRYGEDALVDERPPPQREELPAVRAQLRELGPLGAYLQALAMQHAKHSRRTYKHTPHAQRGAVSEVEWWSCLLESLGLPSLSALAEKLPLAGPLPSAPQALSQARGGVVFNM